MKDIDNIIFKGTCDLAVAKKFLLMMRSILAKVGFFVIYACDVAHFCVCLICLIVCLTLFSFVNWLRFNGQFVFIFL